ncbi:MAG TPA: substrate-binding domain-containing protein [Solirubrobacteraceae bacterium]|jgi:ribose transport system substrate-binding protein
MSVDKHAVHRRSGWWTAAMPAVLAAVALSLSACGSSSSGGSSGGASGGSSTVAGTSAGSDPSGGSSSAAVSQANAAIQKALAVPTKIQETESVGRQSGKLIYNVSCNLAIVGCGEISGEVGDAVKALGDKFARCNAGATATQAQSCFTNAVNAHAAAIVVNDVPEIGSGSGYRQAQSAHIPIVGAFSGNNLKGVPGQVTQAAENAPQLEAKLLADYVIAKSGGKAHVLYISENQDNDGVLRGKSFLAEMKKCTTCQVTTVLTNQNTQTTSAPPQITAALQKDQSINWVIGNQDTVSALAVTAIDQVGRQSSIEVGGMDADPQNIQYIKQGRVQVVDATVGQGEVAYAAVWAAGRVIAGQKVPLATPVNIWLIDKSNVSSVPKSGVFFGPTNYQSQFGALFK